MTTKYQWALLAPWASGSGPNQHLDAGAVIDGHADKYGALVSATAGATPVPLPLPLEASPLTQPAADAMTLWHSEFLHLLKPGPGVTIRSYNEVVNS
jgi:hypothetical protein